LEFFVERFYFSPRNLPIVKNKEPRPQGGALKPKFLKPKTEIPKSIDPESSSGPDSG
jgi:hypothetical protein